MEVQQKISRGERGGDDEGMTKNSSYSIPVFIFDSQIFNIEGIRVLCAPEKKIRFPGSGTFSSSSLLHLVSSFVNIVVKPKNSKSESWK